MACIYLANFTKSSMNLIFLRLLKQTYCEQKLIQQSSLKNNCKSSEAPVKFTTNRASRITIAETIGLSEKISDASKLAAKISLGSLAVFLIYFCFLREESDIDEILKGNIIDESDKTKLIKFKLQLSYCEKNGLPTAELKSKIKELEDKEIVRSPFKM